MHPDMSILESLSGRLDAVLLGADVRSASHCGAGSW